MRISSIKSRYNGIQLLFRVTEGNGIVSDRFQKSAVTKVEVYGEGKRWKDLPSKGIEKTGSVDAKEWTLWYRGGTVERLTLDVRLYKIDYSRKFACIWNEDDHRPRQDYEA